MIRLTEGQLKAIGRIAVEFGAIESLVPMLHVLASGADPRTAWEVEGPTAENIGRNLDRLRDAADALVDAVLGAQLRSWITRVYAVKARRERVLHSVWISENPYVEQQLIFKAWIDKRGQHRQERFTEQKLNDIAAEAERVHEEGRSFLSPLMDSSAHPLYRARPSEWGDVAGDPPSS